MFWGLNLKPNRKYTQTATKSFHISQAALDAESLQNVTANQIFISSENQKFLICTLRKNTCEQVMLDLNVAEGDEICFQSVGSGHVTLSGYIIEEDNPFMLNNEEEEEDEEEDSEVDEKIEEDLRNTLNKKAKKGSADKVAAKSKQSKSKLTGEDDEDDEDEDDDDSDLNGTNEFEDGDDDEDDSEIEDEEDDDDEDEDEEDDSGDEEIQPPSAKHPKMEKQQKQQNGVAKNNSAEKEKKEKGNKKENAQQQQQQQKSGGERTLTGGVKVEDVRVGNGAEVKVGKRAQVYYEGRLKSNNKVFDSLKTGNGFKFNVGRGDVIKGWDVGVVGMKVGGKRRITCPPHMAYGARGSPPAIPPNSTLVFEVELKSVN